MRQFDLDEIGALEMFMTMKKSNNHEPLYLDSSLCKASFLSWPQSKRAYDNSFERLRVGVGPVQGVVETGQEYKKKEREEERKDEERDEEREESKKSLGLYVRI
jgi:hypothetical protein